MFNIGSKIIRKITINAIEITILSINECAVALSAPFLSFAPMNLEIREFAPAHILFPTPTKIINNGVI